MTETIKILFLAATPTDAGRIRLDEEFRQIDRMLQVGTERDAFQLDAKFAVRPTELQEALLRHQPHIVHFAGHGTDAEEVVFMDDSGASCPVSKGPLVRLFEILRDNIRVVVLNACYSKPQAEAIGRTIDYTIGTNKSVGDKAAIAFAAAFYRGLSFGRSVHEAFELGKLDVELHRLPGSDAPELLTRAGVDPLEPFVEQREKIRKDYVEDLRSALARLVTGGASEGDAQEVRQAAADGKVILKSGVASGGPQAGQPPPLRVKPHRSLIEVETDAETYRDLMDRLYPPPPGISPQLPAHIFVGREDSLLDVKNLMGVAASSPGLPENSPTVVRGWPGVGKTTLVTFFSRDRQVQEAFPDGVLWASLFFGEDELSQSELENKLLSLLAGWGRVLGSDALLRVPTLSEVTAQLAALLRSKRMLLIVDDVWHEGHATPFMQASGSGCGVLVTTRKPAVARQLTAGRGAVFTLPELSEESSLRLLRILAPNIVEKNKEKCRELARDLEYLPLSLHVAAGLLKKEDELGMEVGDLIEGLRKDVEEHAEFVKASAPVDRSENGLTPTLDALLRRSTDRLDEQARECFAYLGAFAPKPATFDLGAMAAVWQMDDPKPLVRRLADHGLIEPLKNQRFQMHALLVQHARSLLTP